MLFDAGGTPTFAVVVKSSGSKALNNYTVRSALGSWKSSGGEESVLTFAVTYLNRDHKVPDSDRLVDPGFRNYRL